MQIIIVIVKNLKMIKLSGMIIFHDFNLDIIDYNIKTDRPHLIRNIGENILNDVTLFETSQSYVVYMIYLNKFYNEGTIMKFLDCWNGIIKHITSKNDLNMSLDFII